MSVPADTAEEQAGGAVLAHRTAETAGLHRAIFLGLAVLLLALPWFVYPVFLMKVLCFALFACAFNLLLGYGGLLSFGHALFFGWASYAAAHLAKNGLEISGLTLTLRGHSLTIPLYISLPSFTPEFAILFGTAFAAFLGLIAGYISIRRQGIYFAMITLALAQMMYFFALQAPFTGSEDGIQAVPRGKLFGIADLQDDTRLYYLVALIFFAGFLLIYRIVHSPFGQVLKAIRDNEPRAISLGYDANRYKLMVFVLSAALSGLAGATKALVFQLASLTDVHWTMSGEVVLMTLVGGMGTIFGPIAGALIIIAMQDYLAHLGAWVTVTQGVIFVLCVLLFREGIVGVIAKAIKKPL